MLLCTDMKSLLPATVGAPAFVAMLAACTDPLPREERPLAEMPTLSAVVDVDVGVPEDPFGPPNVSPGLSVYMDYAGATCYSLHATTRAHVDGIEPETLLVGGVESSSKDDETYCAKPAIYTPRQDPRDVSSIVVEDHTAAYEIRVGRLFVNPAITLPQPLRPGPVVARIDDPRAIASATVWWRSADGGQSWMKPVDTSTHGELRFAIPAETHGQGTLAITLTIRDNDVSCVGFASCKAIVRGGHAFAVAVE